MRGKHLGAMLVAAAGFFAAAVTVWAYTGGQAEAGQQVFGTFCAGCHGAHLGGAIAPALTSPGFKASWPNALALFQYLSQQMPARSPGSLAKEQYWNLVAWLLSRNGVPADEQPLGPENAGAISLQAPAGEEG